MTQGISDIDVSRRRLRIFLANQAIALGWALKGCCKPCAHRLFTIARWLVPEVQRFLLHRTGSHNRNRRIFEFAVDLGTRLSRTHPGRVLGGFVIVVVFLGSLDLAMRATATQTQPLEENSAFQHEPQIRKQGRQREQIFASDAGICFRNGFPLRPQIHQFRYLGENLKESPKPRTEKE